MRAFVSSLWEFCWTGEILTQAGAVSWRVLEKAKIVSCLDIYTVVKQLEKLVPEIKISRNNSMSGVNEVFELGEKGIIEWREKFPMAERDLGPLTSSLLSCCYGYVLCACKWKPAVDIGSLL